MKVLFFILFIFIVFYISFKRYVGKLKKYNYHLGSSLRSGKTIYYITYQPKHGVYTHIKDLLNWYSFFLPKQITELIPLEYETPELAEKALESFKTQIQSL